MSARIKTEEAPLPPVTSSTPVPPLEVDDGPDEIVREFDVFLSPELCQQIYLLQFPLHHAEIGSFTEARIKPHHGMIEIDQPLPDLPQRHYSVGEPNLSWVTKRTFQSHTIPVETHMCLAKLKEQNGETALHMVPLQHISQMRPALNHVDEDDDDKEDDLDKMDDDDDEKKPLMFKRKESETAANRRLNSYGYKKTSESSEEWQSLQVCDEESIEHQSVMDSVVCPKPDQHVLAEKDESRPKYIESLNYMTLAKSDPGQGHVDVKDIKSIVARLTLILRNGWPIPYAILRSQFGIGVQISDALIFRGLSICAVMVRGNYCLHSQFVALPRNLQHVRTFILLLLQIKGSIKRKQLEAVYEDLGGVSKDKLKVMLLQVAKRTPKGWEARVEDDVAFVASHPEQSELNLKFWEKQNRLNSDLVQKYEAAEP
mmetsp:Transcript_18908/g.24322  ORF Transcript_18908/g.24322 Transcript_18908/m.24322 type:complete len:428 (+) Transcript_18908:222-1505(+)|eukprot:CAMPEP_0198148612 /NCGR_PEP_ID=MMETSP1443-20131203/42318_1 /TAXON_ID=186043 /ORGANISM="Entomoneis sp., Strain CCMP2396" /LENGTH=427 /DNA_ID=CAMNT_0043813335 /DNA_START=136 /DNA_END=1419 /DNA_ORIENTATION=+